MQNVTQQIETVNLRLIEKKKYIDKLGNKIFELQAKEVKVVEKLKVERPKLAKFQLLVKKQKKILSGREQSLQQKETRLNEQEKLQIERESESDQRQVGLDIFGHELVRKEQILNTKKQANQL